MKKVVFAALLIVVGLASSCNTRKQTCPAYSKHPAVSNVVKA